MSAPQADLFTPVWVGDRQEERPAVRRSDPATSRKAAATVAPHRRTIQERVFAAYVARGPATAKEAEGWPDFAGLGFSTVRKRVSELLKAGRLEPTGVVRDGCNEYRVTEGR